MATKFGGYMGKVLKVDLTTQEFSEYPWTDEDREAYLGGKIMAAKILYDNLGPEVKPLSPENWLVITTGPLNATGAPMSSRFNVSTVSPLTGFITSSNCGGDFGIYLKRAGYDALILSGKSEKPIWLKITENEVSFQEAGELWGKTTQETQALLGPNSGKIVIGPAGENLVKYANIFSQERTAGRAGVGAVMGSKNLKAVIAVGAKKPRLNNEAETKEIYKNWVKHLLKNQLTGGQLQKYGTAGLVSLMQMRKVLATKNFKYGQFEDFEAVSGEHLAEKYLIRNKGCFTCPVQCGRQVEVNGHLVKGPELETLGLLGPNILNSDMGLILKWNLLLDELGMDTISTGGTLAFAMELNEKGLWTNGLEFGKTDNLAKVFEDIAYRRGIGDELAEGVKALSAKYGGHEFAIHSKGLELSAYEPRAAVGLGLGYAVSNRGACHLNAGYLILLEGLGLAMDPYTEKSKAELNILLQDIMEAAAAGGNCLFSLYAIIPSQLLQANNRVRRVVNRSMHRSGPIIQMINRAGTRSLPLHLPILPHTKAIAYATGMKLDFGRFRLIGERGYNLERLFNIRRGLKAEDDSLPRRLTEELQDPADPRTRVPLAELKSRYYYRRGWDKEGVPKLKTLRKLSLADGRC